MTRKDKLSYAKPRPMAPGEDPLDALGGVLRWIALFLAIVGALILAVVLERAYSDWNDAAVEAVRIMEETK